LVQFWLLTPKVQIWFNRTAGRTPLGWTKASAAGAQLGGRS
jgi:hypothetical protein